MQERKTHKKEKIVILYQRRELPRKKALCYYKKRNFVSF